MKSDKTYRSLSMLTGLIVTFLFLLIAGPKLIKSVIKSDPWQIPKTFMDWHDDPTAFFLTYFIGYAIIWWKPLWGSMIIITGCSLYFFFNLDTMATLMFIIPAMIVAVFYILYWKDIRTKK
jgi:hypothetical protein